MLLLQIEAAALRSQDDSANVGPLPHPEAAVETSSDSGTSYRTARSGMPGASCNGNEDASHHSPSSMRHSSSAGTSLPLLACHWHQLRDGSLDTTEARSLVPGQVLCLRSGPVHCQMRRGALTRGVMRASPRAHPGGRRICPAPRRARSATCACSSPSRSGRTSSRTRGTAKSLLALCRRVHLACTLPDTLWPQASVIISSIP